MNIKKYLIRLSFIFRPRFWVMNNPFSLAWDRKLNELLDTNPVMPDGKCTVRIGGNCIWIENYPYSFGHPYGWGIEVRPRRETMIRLRRMALDSNFELKGKP